MLETGSPSLPRTTPWSRRNFLPWGLFPGWMGLLGGPALADFVHELLLVRSHELDKRLILSLFMAGGPENHFRKDGSKIDSLGGKRIDQFSSVGAVLLGGDYAVGLQPAQAVGQYIGGDSFIGTFEEFFVGAEAAEHHVAQDQKRPAVAQHFDRSIQGTP
jgi:hypothetical protein